MTRCAWVLVILELFAIIVSYLSTKNNYENPASDAWLALITPLAVYIFILIWAFTLDKESSLRPLQTSIFLGPILICSGATPHYTPVSLFVACLLILVIQVLPVYFAMLPARRCVQQEYRTKTIETSIKIIVHCIGFFPVLFYLVLAMYEGIDDYADQREEHNKFTTYCWYGHSSYTSSDNCWDSFDDLQIPIYTTPENFLPFENATNAIRNEIGVVKNSYLTYYDYMRLKSSDVFLNDGWNRLITSAVQALVLTFFLFSSEVYLRVARTSFADIVFLTIQ